MKQPSEIMSLYSNSKPSKTNIKNSISIQNNISKTKKSELMKYNKINIKTDCNQISLNKNFKKNIALSHPLKRIEIGFEQKKNSVGNTKKADARLKLLDQNKISIRNNKNNIYNRKIINENNLIFPKNNNLIGPTHNKTQYIVIWKNKKINPKPQLKKIPIKFLKKNII